MRAFLVLLLAGAAAAAADFKVPPLPYNMSALAPAIPEDTLKLHYGVHTQNYFNATNALVAKTPALQNKTLAALLTGPAHTGAGVSAADRTTLTNQGGGAYNHGLYFNQLAPTGADVTKTMPADLAKAVDNATIAAWKTAAGSVFGSGWAWLTLAKNGSVVVTTSANQENPLTKGDGIPIAGIDVWEHSYYRAYGPKRADYVTALVANNMNWTRVDENLKAARKGDAEAASGV